MAQLREELSSRVEADPSYDSFTLYLPEEERRRRRAKRVIIVAALMLMVTTAAVVGLLTWDTGAKPRGGGDDDSGGDAQRYYSEVGSHGGTDDLGDGVGNSDAPETTSFMVVGDWGCSINCPQYATADTDQLSVSEQMTRFARRDVNMQWVLSTGDNFYMKGVKSDHDPLWKTVYTDRFGGIDLPWFSVLGNHDHYGNPRAQLSACTDDGCPDVPPQWNLPWFNYTISRPAGGGMLQMVFIDTFILGEGYSGRLMKEKTSAGELHHDDMDFFMKHEKERAMAKSEQKRWLAETLAKSKADWLVVIGHYPVYSGGEHGNTPELITDIKPLLERYGVDFYLCGHDHSLQHLESGGVDYVVSGGGSLKGRVGLGAFKETQYASDANGFAVFKIDPDRAQVTLVGAFGQTLYHFQRNKRRNTEGATASKGGGELAEIESKNPRMRVCLKSCETLPTSAGGTKNCVGTRSWHESPHSVGGKLINFAAEKLSTLRKVVH